MFFPQMIVRGQEPQKIGTSRIEGARPLNAANRGVRGASCSGHPINPVSNCWQVRRCGRALAPKVSERRKDALLGPSGPPRARSNRAYDNLIEKWFAAFGGRPVGAIPNGGSAMGGVNRFLSSLNPRGCAALTSVCWSVE